LILPGDGSAEWKGFLDDDLVPWAKNPKAGFISTANNDPIGVTLDNDPSNDTLPDGTPMYLHCTFDIGFREGRIQKRITDHTAPFKQEDLSAIQGDHHSSMGARLTSYLILAIDAAEAERTTPGAHPDLAKVVADPSYDKTWIGKVRTLLDGWKALDYEAASGIDPTTNKPLDAAANKDEVAASQAASIFNTWLVRARSRIIGDELQTIGAGVDSETASKALLHLFEADPATLATYDATTKDSAIWDDLATPEVESRLDRIVRALLDAKSVLDMQFGMDPATYRWGALHTIRFESLISVIGDLSIPPAGDTTFPSGFPRPGDLYNVDACDFPYVSLMSAPKFSYGHGPTQRFVVEMDPAGPKAVNALPGGEIWDNKSSHFADEVELWRRNQVHPIPFLLDDVVKAKEARTVAFTPAK
jgi:penicillin amidase